MSARAASSRFEIRLVDLYHPAHDGTLWEPQEIQAGSDKVLLVTLNLKVLQEGEGIVLTNNETINGPGEVVLRANVYGYEMKRTPPRAVPGASYDKTNQTHLQYDTIQGSSIPAAKQDEVAQLLQETWPHLRYVHGATSQMSDITFLQR